MINTYSSPQFIAKLNADPVIRQLEAERLNLPDEIAALVQVLGGRYRVTPSEPRRWWQPRHRGVALNPITPAIWSLWWALNLPYVHDAPSEEFTELAADIALYTLTRRVTEIAGSTLAIAGAAIGMCRKLRLKVDDVNEVICLLARDAIRPLEMLPASLNNEEGRINFGADWVTQITGAVAQRMNYPAHLIATERSLAEVALHFCWVIAAADSKMDIRRRTPEDICAQIWARTQQLADEWRAETCLQES